MTFFKDTEVFLSRGIKFFLFLIPFIPLYISPSIVFPYITGKNFAFRILIELAAVLWLVLVFINRTKWFRNSSMLLSILCFTFIVGLADLFGVNPYKSFWSNYERMEGYITILHLLLYFIVLKNMFKTKEDWKAFFGLIFVVSIGVCFFAINISLKANPAEGLSRYAIEYGTRVASTIGNPPFLASYLLLSIFIGIILILNEKRRYLKSVYIAVILLNSTVIYLTATRGVMLAGVAGIIIFALFYLIGRKSINRMSLLRVFFIGAIVIFLVVSMALLVLNFADILDQGRTLSRFKSMFSDPSVTTRLDAWEMALPAIKERPLLGWGQENFNVVYTLNPIELVAEHIWLDRAHNIIIDWLINAGFLGLLSYVLVFITAVYNVKKAYRANRIKMTEASVLVTALITYFIQNLFIFDTINTYIIFFALLAYIDNLDLFVRPSAEKQEDNIDETKMKVRYLCAVLMALLVFSVMTYQINYKPIQQNRQALKVSVLTNETLPSLSEEFKELLSFNTFGNADVRGRMLSLARTVVNLGLLGHEGGAEFVKLAAEELWKGAESNRYDHEYFFSTINLFYMISRYEPAYIDLTEALIKECMRINPGFQWLYMSMADVDVLKGDYESAYANVSNIVDIHSENDMHLMKLALAAILVSKDSIFSDTLDKIKNIRSAADRNIALGNEPVFSIFEVRMIADNYIITNDLQQALHYYKEITAMPDEYNRRMLKKRYLPWMIEVYRKISGIYLAFGEEAKAAEFAEKADKLE